MLTISYMELLPQTDFYQYVNHKWLNDPSNSIPDDYASWGGFTKLQDDIINLQIGLLRKLETCSERSAEETKITAIWQGSQNLLDNWNNGHKDYSSVVTELSLLNEYFASEEDYILKLAAYLFYAQTNGIRSIIDFDKGSDLQNVNNVILDFSVGGLSLPSPEYYYLDKFADKREQYKNHLTSVVDILKENNIDLSPNFVENVLDFETKLAKFLMKPAQSREYDKYYTNTTLKELYQNINELRSLPSKEENYDVEDRNFKLPEDQLNNVKLFFETLYRSFDFRTVLKSNLNKNFKDCDKPPLEDQITTYDGDAIRRYLNLVLDETNHYLHYSYMQYCAVSSCRSFCSKELDEEFFDFYQRKLGGQKNPKSADKRSVERVNAYSGEMLGQLFVKQYFSENSKSSVQLMINNVLEIMRESLQNSDWLTAPTREKAVEKLNTFRSKIGYPEVWKDYSDLDFTIGDSLYQISKKAKKWSLRVNFFEKINSQLDRDEWRMNPQTVNAYFMPTQNEIVFPAAILQPPFFHTELDTIDFDYQEELTKLSLLLPEDPKDLIVKSVNYGGIGAVIAHEITHGYDDKGRKFDLDGNLNDWWTQEDTDLFIQKTQNIVNSVNKYSYTDESGKVYNMDSELTMGENLADIGGLSLSMKALLTDLNNQEVSDLCLRIFFKSWANVWKQNIKPEKRIMLLSVDPHGPTDFRGNLVQHMDKFYEVFNVSDKDQMYIEPEFRMKMW